MEEPVEGPVDEPMGDPVDEQWEGELYPFLADDEEEGKGEPADPAPVLEDVGQSTRQKARDVTELRTALRERHLDDLVRMARILAASFAGGGKVLTFGNGGSATDARDLAADLTRPQAEDRRRLPAIDLTRDQGVLTAVANDVAFENVFVRQIIAYGEEGDVAVGFSTSGQSRNVISAFEQARDRGMRTLGFAGFDGGRMGSDGFLDVCVVAPSSYVPRIQEAHATAYHSVLAMTHDILGGGSEA